MTSKFEIFKGSNGQFYYHLKARNGEKILSGEGYASKQSCQAGIVSVKSNAPYDIRYRKLVAANGQHYFTIVSSNGETIGKSELYITSAGRDQGIEVVKREAPTASVVDTVPLFR